MIKWKDVTKETTEKVSQVVERAKNEGYTPVSIPEDIAGDFFGLWMDLQAVSLIVNLDWEGLLKAPLVDFYHDLSGIQRHLNRKTGKLENCFLPRFAK